MLFVLAAGFWLLALVAAVRLAAAARVWAPGGRLLWLAVLLAGAVLLFRPHEDVFGGEDPGSYFNAGVTYGRRGSLTYQDPLLARVPPGSRPVFYYGHAGYGLTKDACLWIHDPDRAVVGPRFHPAYTLLIAAVSRLAGPAAGLYVVPLFALGTALALAVLAGRLLPHPMAGIAAAAVYLLNPLTLWHGRCARAELVAGFAALAGLACLALAWRERGARSWADAFLAGLCLGAAPLFHVSAWYIGVPAALAVLLGVGLGRLSFAAFLPAAGGMLLLFYAQTVRVTDAYRMRALLEQGFRVWPVLAAGILLAIALGLAMRRRARGRAVPAPPRPAFAVALAGASLAFFIHSWLTRDAGGSLPWLGKPIEHFAYLTHWQAVINMLSVPVTALALAGWCLWLTGPAERRTGRIVLALLLFPALLLAGTIRDFMMTRYLMTAVVPMTALCLAALATLSLPARPGCPQTRWLAVAAALLIGLGGLAGRTHLVTTVEHRGLLAFLSGFAHPIQRDRGMLLGEYSRLTAPLEHGFGIPALGLDAERRDDYRLAEAAWAALMTEPDAPPAFFATPFQTPRSDRFVFEPIRHQTFTERVLQQRGDALPDRVLSWDLGYSLFRMRLNTGSAAPPLAAPVELPIGPGNMGFRRWAACRAEHPALETLALASGDTVRIPLPVTVSAAPGEALVFAMTPRSAPAKPSLRCALAAAPGELAAPDLTALSGGWTYARVRLPAGAAGHDLTVSAGSALTLGAAFLRQAGICQPLAILGPTPSVSRAPSWRMARWTRTASELLMPASPGATLFLLAYAPLGESGTPPPTLTLGDGTAPGQRARLRPDTWQWVGLAAPAADHETWMPLRADPPYNPRQRGFPDDLGVLVGALWVCPP